MSRQRIKQLQGSVLVADDHDVLRYGLIQLLRSELCVDNTLQANNFQDALVRLENRDIVLAILDLGMPGLDGPADLAEVRRRRPDIRVVVLSGSDERADILGALEAGVHGYIIKTSQMDLLIDRLAYVMSGEIYVPAVLAKRPLQAAVSPGAKPQGLSGVFQLQPVPAQANPLSDRQRQVLEGLVMGRSNKQIARELKLAEGTVKMHIGALFRALGANNRAHAAALGKKLLD